MTLLDYNHDLVRLSSRPCSTVIATLFDCHHDLVRLSSRPCSIVITTLLDCHDLVRLSSRPCSIGIMTLLRLSPPWSCSVVTITTLLDCHHHDLAGLSPSRPCFDCHHDLLDRPHCHRDLRRLSSATKTAEREKEACKTISAKVDVQGGQADNWFSTPRGLCKASSVEVGTIVSGDSFLHSAGPLKKPTCHRCLHCSIVDCFSTFYYDFREKKIKTHK